MDLPQPSGTAPPPSPLRVDRLYYEEDDRAEPEIDELIEPERGHALEPEASEAAAPETPAEVEPLESLRQRAQEARSRLDWGAAAAFYEAVFLRAPEDAASATACAEAYRNGGDRAAADLVLEHFHSENGASVGIGINYALNAQAGQDWQEARQRWRDLRLAFPDVGAAWAAEAAMLLILGRVDEAEGVLLQAIAHLPANIEILAQYAGVSMARQDWLGALQHISAIEMQAPLDPSVESHFATLRDLVMVRIGDLPLPALMDEASRAEQSRNWERAVHGWQVIYGRYPDTAWAIIGYGQALREHGMFDEADRILGDAVATTPDNQELFAHYAQVPAARNDWTTAAHRWQHNLLRFPDTPAVWSMAATAFLEAGLFEPADMLLSRAIAREPARLDLRVQYALVAERQENWPLAVERWDTAHRLSPDEPNIRNSRGDAIWQDSWERLERGDHPASPAEPSPETHSTDMKQVALQFEGLGDNCEFGVVQRYFGADPIGLFRFAAISAETLTKLLAERFERLGDPRCTTLSLTSGNEYLVRDDRGFYHLHSFVRKGSVDEGRFLGQQVKRLTYLKRKLLEDLQESRKIFVHKSSLLRIDDDAALRLHDAIAQFGPNILLVIRRAEADQQPGALAVLRRGLLVGHVSTLYSGEGSPVDFDSWRSVLLAACDYRRSLAQGRPDTSRP